MNLNLWDLREYHATDEWQLRLMLRALFTILERDGRLHKLKNEHLDWWVAERARLERERALYQSS